MNFIQMLKLELYLSFQMNSGDVSGEKSCHTSTKKCFVIVRSQMLKSSGEKVKHFVAALQNGQKHVVVNVFWVINVFRDSFGAVGLATRKTRDGSSQDNVVARFCNTINILTIYKSD